MSDTLRRKPASSDNGGRFFPTSSAFASSNFMQGFSTSPDVSVTGSEEVAAITIASEASLKKIWDTPEEDEAWKDL